MFFIIALIIHMLLPSASYAITSKENSNQTSQQLLQLSKIRKKYEYVYLRAKKVNLRSGPSKRYPINWTLRNKGEPLKFLDSFYQWIRVQDVNGYKGWLQAPMITTRYMYGVIINNTTDKPIIGYAMTKINSRKIVKLAPGVRVQVLKCVKKKWCKIRVNEFKAWINYKNLWGINS